MKNDKIYFSYDELTHTTRCQRTVHNHTYEGISRCHPRDWDFENRLTGEHYAYVRSLIAELVEQRENLKAEVKTLRHLHDLFDNNLQVNPSGTAYSLLDRQLKHTERDLSETRMLIKNMKEDLRRMMDQKDAMYFSLRQRRKLR